MSGSDPSAEVLQHKVILRFRKGVETQRLAEDIVDDSDCAQVDAGKVCRLTQPLRKRFGLFSKFLRTLSFQLSQIV